MSAAWESQVACYDALIANTTFTNLIGSRLFDEPQTNNVYPYVTVGDTTEIADNRLLRNGFEVTLTFHIYTKPAGLGFYTAKKILEAMNNVLNMKKFTMTSYTMVICQYENMVTERDDDKRIISARYRIIAHSDTIITF